MGNLFWEFKKKRVNEEKRKDLPKTRTSKDFSTKKEALAYSKKHSVNWLQATLFELGEEGYKAIARITTKGKYDEKYV